MIDGSSELFDRWLGALGARHLANLTRSELTRALRALSSCYVERRERLTRGGALDSAGKRAAFALFYAPLHFLTTTAIIDALGFDRLPVREIVDAGCGTGAAGAAWATAAPGGRPAAVRGVDLNPWAVQEANWTYAALKINGRAAQGDIASMRLRVGPSTALLLAYTINELPDSKRAALLPVVQGAIERHTPVLLIEPIARRVAPWWPRWMRTLAAVGARENEWRFPAVLPTLLADLARGAGLRPHELTARTISFCPPR